MSDPIKVLIVDDSRLFRSALELALAGESDIQVIGSVFSGAKALEFIRLTPPDVVTLDVEMPGMDGLATLVQLQSLSSTSPAPGVVMVSAFTRRGAEITVKALQAGAFDVVTKPSGASPEENVALLRSELLAKVRACARRPGASPTRLISNRPPHKSPGVAAIGPVRAIVIGASTGGPRALSVLLPPLCALVDVPIAIVQHMPPGFTRSLAESLAKQTGKNVVEAADQLPFSPASVYIAPGGKHLLIRASAAGPLIGLTDQPPENGCRPSADVLFRSAAATFGSAVAAIILTGMGRDGTTGLGAIKRAGGTVFAQDEASSVVWGMPGSAFDAGVTDELLPLDQIAQAVAGLVSRNGRTKHA